MRVFLLMFVLSIPFVGYSQDSIILRNGKKINCKITKVDSTSLYYNFLKGERELSSFISKDNIRSYQFDAENNIKDKNKDKTLLQENLTVIDTTRYVKEVHEWVNLLTYSQKFGVNSNGWAVQYYGYNLISTAKWSFPIKIGIEAFELSEEYFSESNYMSASMSYFQAGLSPFYKLSDQFFLNLGINLVYGEEELVNMSGRESSNTFFGVSPSQGIYFIPKSKIGITIGLGVYEKLLSSKVYKSDVGVKLEVGIKF